MSAHSEACRCPACCASSAPPAHSGLDANAAPQGWECPKCHVVNGPHVDRCPCTAGAAAVAKAPATGTAEAPFFNTSVLDRDGGPL